MGLEAEDGGSREAWGHTWVRLGLLFRGGGETWMAGKRWGLSRSARDERRKWVMEIGIAGGPTTPLLFSQENIVPKYNLGEIVVRKNAIKYLMQGAGRKNKPLETPGKPPPSGSGVWPPNPGKPRVFFVTLATQVLFVGCCGGTINKHSAHNSNAFCADPTFLHQNECGGTG